METVCGAADGVIEGDTCGGKTTLGVVKTASLVGDVTVGVANKLVFGVACKGSPDCGFGDEDAETRTF